MSNFGKLFKISTFGESHCPAVGVVIENTPPNITLTKEDIQPQLTRRRPGQSSITTPRKESDLVEILSGVEDNKTLGTPICLLVKNQNTKPKDYGNMVDIPRPGHADFTYLAKYGIKAKSGGGRSSARETIGRVAAGAVAEKILRIDYSTEIVCFVLSVGNIILPKEKYYNNGKVWTRKEIDQVGEIKYLEIEEEKYFIDYEGKVYNDKINILEKLSGEDLIKGKEELVEVIPTRCPDVITAIRIVQCVKKLKEEEDSMGGTAMCIASNVPIGLGEPCFDKLEAKLAHAMLSLPATKGFEIGSGFEGTKLKGSEHNDLFGKSTSANGMRIHPKTNHAGGTLGGISTGENLEFKIAVKPVSTIAKKQETVDFDGNKVTLEARGRHDPCVLPRVPPLVEAMTSLVLLDAAMIQKSRNISTETILPNKRKKNGN
eukprot:snap_masked-scaffold_21-processed-gene-0.18-mRNA-1 protein AED:0.00 eAED:0.00 QI:0/-1/0/1/-1/1/1/0/430